MYSKVANLCLRSERDFLPPAPKGREFDFSPGQMITLILPLGNHCIARVPFYTCFVYAEENNVYCLPPLGTNNMIPVNVADHAMANSAFQNKTFVDVMEDSVERSTVFYTEIKHGIAGLTMDCRVGLHWLFCCGCKTKTSFGFLVKKRGRFFRKVKK